MENLFKKGLGVFVSIDGKDSYDRMAITRSDAEKLSEKRLTVKIENHVAPQPNVGKFKDYFSDKMKQMDLPGPDYHEFSQENENFKSDIPDEKARFKVVMKSFQRDGLTKDKLIQSANYYLTEFQKDKETFLKTVSEKEKNDIGAKKAAIDALEKQNKIIEDLIQQKKTESQTNKDQIAKLQDEMVLVEEKIKANESGYLLAFDEVVGIINEDIKKIQTVL